MSYIDREAVLDRLAKVDMDPYYGFTAAVQFGVDHAIQCIKEEPAADVAPVVHCRECKHYHAGTGWCDQLSFFQTSDGEPCSPAESMDWKMLREADYCSMGQRKEAAHD